MSRRQSKRVLDAQTVIAQQMEKLPDNFLDCRDPGLRHKWERESDFHVIPVTEVGRRRANLARVEVCERCGTRKVERFAVNAGDLLEKVSQHYEYPEGYLMAGVGVPRGLKRSSVVWSENYRRAMEKVATGLKGGSVTPLRKRA